MTKKLKHILKKNYELFSCILLLLIVLFVSINPAPYMSSCFQGLKIWATTVLPSLFCFMIVTKLILQNRFSSKIFSTINAPFQIIFKTPYGGYIFLMSIISGYPLGCKLIKLAEIDQLKAVFIWIKTFIIQLQHL